MMSDFLALPEVRAGYSDYMSMLNERGVTAIKKWRLMTTTALPTKWLAVRNLVS